MPRMPPMEVLLPCAQAASVILLAIFAGLLGTWLATRTWWFLAYLFTWTLLLTIGVARFQPLLAIQWPISWIMRDRLQHVVFAALTSVAVVTPLFRSSTPGRKRLAWVLLSVAVLYQAVTPFLLPMLMRDEIAALPTKIDQDGVCLQSTKYTCGPAAAVTILRRMNVYAEEAELASVLHTVPWVGTPAGLLAHTLEERYADQGVRCQYRRFDSVDDMAGHEPILALMHMRAREDHYVVVLKVHSDGLIIADPMQGKGFCPRDKFEEYWRKVGIEVHRDGDARS